MTDNEMNKMLADLIAMYSSAFGKGLTRKAAQKLAVFSVEHTLHDITGDAYAQAKAALCSCGAILEGDETNKTISGLIYAGVANLNPSFLVLWIERDAVHIKASAKEGLIKQHTAEHAIRIFESALNALNSDLSKE